MVEEQEKIACHVCAKEIPKAAAVHAEGSGYVHYFCETSCLLHWKDEKKKKDERKK